MFAAVIGAYIVRLVVTLYDLHCRAAIGAEIRRGHIPTDEIAFGIVGATVKSFACFGGVFTHVSAALGAFADNFDDALDVFALRIVGASKERTVFAVTNHHFAPHLSQISSLSSSGR